MVIVGCAARSLPPLNTPARSRRSVPANRCGIGRRRKSGRVGKHRLTISLWQVCADPSQNRACTSQCTRLAVVLLNYIFSKSMMNLFVAVTTYHQCFSAFYNHNYFPRLFAFQIFHLVHMMHFVFSVFSLITT